MNLLQEELKEMIISTKKPNTQKPPRIFEKTNVDVSKCEGNKFICDSSLSRVAKHLRLLGIDCVHDQDMTSSYLIYLSKTENRIILTRSKKLLLKIVPEPKKEAKTQEIESEEVIKWREAKKLNSQMNNNDFMDPEMEEESSEDDSIPINLSYFLIEAKGASDQIMEVVTYFKIEFNKSNLFTRCLECNTPVKLVEKETIKDRVYKDTYNHNNEFYFCKKCDKVFWGDEDNSNYLSAIKFAEKNSFKK
jgi:uncharacterized protein with PIN domain